MAAPCDFVPVPPGWEKRSILVERIGRLDYYHFGPYAQALAKLERGHQQDLADAREMVSRNLVDPARALQYFARIEPALYRYPAIHARAFRRGVEEFFGG